MYPSPTRKTPTRRVCFSERVFYSDDPSTSTTSTDDDDELFEEETIESFDEETIDSEPGEEKSTPVVLSNTTSESNPEENQAKVWDPLDEAPLSFRDSLSYTRPTEFLGGSGPEVSGLPPHRVKLRKNWLLDQDQDHQDYSEFEQWKKSRSSNSAKKDGSRETTCMVNNVDSSNFATFRSLSMCGDKDSADGDGKLTQKMVPSNKIDAIKPENLPEKSLEATISVAKKEATFDTKEADLTTAPTKKPLKSSLKGKHPKTYVPREIPPPKSDKECDAYDKEIVELKEKVAKLQRQLDTIEVRHISQLADVEEETTKRMREFRESANDVERRMRAKEEKKGLKEKAMKSHDLIDHLRKSNQKLRAEGIKIQEAVAKLKESNQLLEEKDSFHGDYATQFQNFQKVEVDLAEGINKALKRDVPRYKELVRDMEEGVVSRDRNGQIESFTKEIYLDCMHTIFGLLEESSEDHGVIEEVANMMEETDSSEDQVLAIEVDVPEKTEEIISPKRSPRRSSSKPVSEMRPSPSKSIRRSNSVGSKTSSQNNFKRVARQPETLPRSTPQKWPSFRSTRIPKNRKPASDDDSSTCSIDSAVSDSFSLDYY